jgi:glycosyltransferase involved in cell wall biosynthesis
MGWWPFAVWAGARSLLREPADVIYAVGKPWTGFFVGYALKVLFRKPLVIDFMDPWRGGTWTRSRGRILDRVQDRLESFIVRRADYLVANTQELADDFAQRLQVPAERLGVITCGYNPVDFVEREEPGTRATNAFTITHAGSFYKQRTPLHFLQALRRLFDAGLPENVIRIQLVGNLRVDSPELRSLLTDPRIDRVVQRDAWVPHAEALRRMRASDVLLLVQPDTQLQIPAKLYEYAAVGRPILALADAGGAVDNLLRRQGWGSAVRYDDVDAIADELQALYEAWRDGQLAARNELRGVEAFSYPALASELARIFDSLTTRATRPATVMSKVEAPA